MVKALKISNVTHSMLVRVMGEFTATLGKRLSFDEVIQLLIQEHDAVVRRMQSERQARPPFGDTPSPG